jgi:hypothetical protein
VLTAVVIAVWSNLIGSYNGDGLCFLCRTNGGSKLRRNTKFSSLKVQNCNRGTDTLWTDFITLFSACKVERLTHKDKGDRTVGRKAVQTHTRTHTHTHTHIYI